MRVTRAILGGGLLIGLSAALIATWPVGSLDEAALVPDVRVSNAARSSVEPVSRFSSAPMFELNRDVASSSMTSPSALDQSRRQEPPTLSGIALEEAGPVAWLAAPNIGLGPYREGENIGEWVISEIGATGVTLTSGDQTVRLSLFAEQ